MSSEHKPKKDTKTNAALPSLGNSQEAPFNCVFCGRPSWIDPSDQTPPPDYCHESDHGSADDYKDDAPFKREIRKLRKNIRFMCKEPSEITN